MKRSLRSWLWRVPVDREVDEEIAFHIEMRTRELVERGMDPTAAREEALRRAGDVNRLRTACVDLGRRRDRSLRLTQYLQEFADDVRFGARQLMRAPGFTFVAAVTLALGIGANSAIFALADATLIRPLPYPDSDRLVTAFGLEATSARTPIGLLDYHDFREQNHTFEAMAALALGGGGGPLLTAPDGTVESVDRQTVTAGFFDVLGVRAVAGRTFVSTDEGPRTNVIVVSKGLWRARFGGDFTERHVRLSGEPYTVVGVVADEVQFTRPASIWTLLPTPPATFNQRGQRFLHVVGRLKPGVAFEEAQADLSVIADRLAREFPKTNQDVRVTVSPFRVGLMGRDLRLTSMFLVGVVGVVLLMCCANVANLLLARANVRTRELAVRSALGAGRSRIVRQLLTESLVLAALGGALGIACGAAILAVAPSLIPVGLLPAAVTLAFDVRVVAFCAVSTLAVGLVFGLIPAWQAASRPLAQTIGSEGRSSTRHGGRLRNLLASGEVAAAALLLCAAGLLLRTLLVLGSFEPGYRADGDSVVTLDFTVPGAGYPTPERLLQFYDAVERDVRALPLVRRVGWASSLPWGTTEFGRMPFEIVGDEPVGAQSRPGADFTAASPGYFQTLGISIVAGREFSAADTARSTPVCIVNEAFVRRHLAGRNPIGARVAIRPSILRTTPLEREIVGVARQVPGRPDDPNDLLQVYVPLTQAPIGDVFLVVQSAAGKPEALVPSIRAAVAQHDANVPVRRIRTLDDLAGEATARYRFRAVMVGTFAGLALLLAMVGVFGVLAYSIQQRSREFGVRIALGATKGNVLALVLASATRTIVAGAVLGLAGAALLSQSISAFLYGVEPLDPLTFGVVAVVLVATAAVAIAAPAFRAAHIDPSVALRQQ